MKTTSNKTAGRFHPKAGAGISVLKFCALMAGLLGAFDASADYPLMYQRYMADPCGIEYNGRLYLYGSNDSDNQTNYAMHTINCISTDDLKNWTDHGTVIDVPNDIAWARHTWAPQVVFRNGLFYMYVGDGTAKIAVTTNASPTGPFRDARGTSLINSGTPGASGGGQWCFDPGCFVDDDGQAYLTFGGQFTNNARIIKLNSDMISTSGSAVEIPAPIFFEGSYIHKYNGNYYYSYESQPGTGMGIHYGISSSPMSGYSWGTNVVLSAPANSGNNQAAFFTYKGVWYAVYHNRWLSGGEGFHRNCGLDRLYYNADGTMQTVNCTQDGLTQLKYLNPYNRVEAETMARESGIKTENCSEGGMDVGFINNSEWIEIRGVDFGSGASDFTARVASATGGGNIELRLDSTDGTLVGTCSVPGTGGWQNWTSQSCAVSGATGVHDLYLVFTGGGSYLFNFNWWQFTSEPVAGGTYKVISRNSGKAMDAYGGGTANGTQIIQWTYGGGGNQKWTATDTGSGYYKIIGVQSGKSLDIDYQYGGTANGTKVQLWDYWNGPSQQWTFAATGGGYYRITPNCATGSCLDVNGYSTSDGAIVQLWQWRGTANQQWSLQAP